MFTSYSRTCLRDFTFYLNYSLTLFYFLLFTHVLAYATLPFTFYLLFFT